MKRTFLLLVAAALLSLNLFADTVTVNSGDASSATDLFQAATVVNSDNVWENSDARDAFGGAIGAVEPGNVLAGAASTAWIHFRTASTSVNQFTISMHEDSDTGKRSASNIKIWMYDGVGTVGVDWTEVFSQDLNADYVGAYGSAAINVVATLDTAVVNTDWLVRWESADDFGARVMEVDGVVPEPATASLMALVGGLGFLIRRHFVS